VKENEAMKYKSYLDKEFTIISNEARIRREDDLTKPATFKAGDEIPAGYKVGDFKIIPKRTQVTVSDVRTDAKKNVYVHAHPVGAADGTPSGWTIVTNLEGTFINETTGLAPAQWDLLPAGTNKTVTDARALVRGPGPTYAPAGGTIPKGTYVVVLEASEDTEPKGKYVRVVRGTVAGGALERGEELGWTAASNLSEGCAAFYNSPAWSDQQGPNACWDHGKFVGQKLLVNIVGTGGEMEQITYENLDAYFTLINAAAKDNIIIGIESGFRTYAKQKYLYDGYKAKKPGFNLAAAPGRSNHQHGQAFDFNTRGFDGHPVYDWLKQHGPAFGFIRTVKNEHWHWEYRPADAAALAKQGKFKPDSLVDTKK
jgi:hypothetical protein